MTIRERIDAFWSGEKPDEIPYAIYAWLFDSVADDPAWQPMMEAGLGVIRHMCCYTERMANVEIDRNRFSQDGHDMVRLTYTTPVGSVVETQANGWQGEHFLKTPDDYRVMTHIVENTHVEPDLARFEAQLAELGLNDIPLSLLSRSPYQRMLVDWAGVGQFPFHLADFPEAVEELYHALWKLYRRRVEIAASASNRFVHFGENFNAAAIGPARYEKYILPVYQECIGMLHDAGKVVGAHYDGHTACCAEVINRSPLDLVESFTEPPEGDQPLGVARANWPDKLIWCNIGVRDYQLPADVLRQRVLAMAAAGAPDGKRLAFEVSEHLPVDWRTAMPVVQAALAEMREK